MVQYLLLAGDFMDRYSRKDGDKASILLKMRFIVSWKDCPLLLSISPSNLMVSHRLIIPILVHSTNLLNIQCGNGTTEDELSPKCVSSLLGIRILGIAAGLWHTLCNSIDGGVYAFGGNQFGQLGTGLDQAESIPKLLTASLLESTNAKIVSCGARHNAIVTDDNRVFSWGWNKYGQLGLGDSIDRSLPSQVPIDNLRVVNVSCGWWHTLAHAQSPA